MCGTKGASFHASIYRVRMNAFSSKRLMALKDPDGVPEHFGTLATEVDMLTAQETMVVTTGSLDDEVVSLWRRMSGIRRPLPPRWCLSQ